jgi:FMN-dependent oxidoreductase (nitrilotriacetate monooxygenase family)
MSRLLHLNGFLVPFGHHPGSWLRPEATWEEVVDPQYFARYARTAERGLFDSVFLSDAQHVIPIGGATEKPNNIFEPLTMMGYLAAETERVGLIGTVSSTFSEPYNIARQLASIALLSRGRAGVNLVTSQQPEAARNHGMAGLPSHQDRYDRAAEFAEALEGLWRSWTPSAVAMDKEENLFFDEDAFAPPRHAGAHFQVDGPLNVPTPYGSPVVVQAGASEQGRSLAARFAEAIYGVGAQFEDARDYYADIKRRTLAAGRRADDIAVLPGVIPILGETMAAAMEKKAYLDSLMSTKRRLAILGAHIGMDTAGWDLDNVMPELPPLERFAGPQGRYGMMLALSRENGRLVTVGRMLEQISAGNGHFTLVGTPSSVADELVRWFGDGAADGFNVNAPLIPGDFDYFVDAVVPELQERGVFRTAYAGSTLRGHLRQTSSSELVGG